MNPTEYFKSISDELDVLKDRVRSIISNHHWPTDGEWKESILRTILRRHLPSTVEVARGFIIQSSRISTQISTQIDIMIIDISKPVLYRDGDLVFVTPDSVRGIIEVKTKLQPANISRAFEALANNAQIIRNMRISNGLEEYIFIGLFSYEENAPCERVLQGLKDAAQGNTKRVINHVCIGKRDFFRFWEESPNYPATPTLANHPYNAWHAYDLRDLARGYFIVNVIDAVSGNSVRRNNRLWYPRFFADNQITDKELHQVGIKHLIDR
jgi:hypothetical protein